jgi:hypothetical protein
MTRVCGRSTARSRPRRSRRTLRRRLRRRATRRTGRTAQARRRAGPLLGAVERWPGRAAGAGRLTGRLALRPGRRRASGLGTRGAARLGGARRCTAMSRWRRRLHRPLRRRRFPMAIRPRLPTARRSLTVGRRKCSPVGLGVGRRAVRTAMGWPARAIRAIRPAIARPIGRRLRMCPRRLTAGWCIRRCVRLPAWFSARTRRRRRAARLWRRRSGRAAVDRRTRVRRHLRRATLHGRRPAGTIASIVVRWPVRHRCSWLPPSNPEHLAPPGSSDREPTSRAPPASQPVRRRDSIAANVARACHRRTDSNHRPPARFEITRQPGESYMELRRKGESKAPQPGLIHSAEHQ